MKRTYLKLAIAAIPLCGMAFLQSCIDKEKTEPVGEPCEKTWYADTDGDGKGDANVTMEACEQPEGYVDNSDDFIDAKKSTKQIPMLFKITGETCYFCGDWGWDAWKQLADKFKNGKGLSWSNYGVGYSNGYFRNQELVPTMEPIEKVFEDGGSKPNFATNGTDYGTSYANAEAAANESLTKDAEIAAVLEASIDGDKLTIKAEAEFLKDMNGEYVMGAYLIEDNVSGPQSGPIGASGNVDHHLVMRGSLSADAWGEQIATETTAMGTTVQKTYTVDIPASYNRENFSYGVVVWKKIGIAYRFINAYSTQ